MIYKFDIQFGKKLKDGGFKSVTYQSILENPDIFGKDEGFADAIGELSLVLDGPEAGLSLNALYKKYRAMLVGNVDAGPLDKGFPLKFIFTSPDNPTSLRMELRDDDGHGFTSDFRQERIEGNKIINLSDIESFVIIIAKDNACSISDDKMTVILTAGQICFCSGLTEKVSIIGEIVVLYGIVYNNSYSVNQHKRRQMTFISFLE